MCKFTYHSYKGHLFYEDLEHWVHLAGQWECKDLVLGLLLVHHLQKKRIWIKDT